jgi:hypothetical protein
LGGNRLAKSIEELSPLGRLVSACVVDPVEIMNDVRLPGKCRVPLRIGSTCMILAVTEN